MAAMVNVGMAEYDGVDLPRRKRKRAGMGMMMTINYHGVYTPFEMGTRSGNMPE